MAEDSAERSAIEVKHLLRKLHPKSGSHHKDRVRLLNRFRNYATGAGGKGPVTTPELYDDDLPLLMLGSKAPAALVDEELSGLSLYGLIDACGTPSSDHGQKLKRSARNAMNLLKFLVCDFKEMVDGNPVSDKIDPKTGEKELNGFAHALCCCTVENIKGMNVQFHVSGSHSEGTRGGAKEDACHVLVLLITRHLAEDGETPMPLGVEELLPDQGVRKAFDSWLMTQRKDIQNAVKRGTIEHDARFKKEQAAGAFAKDDNDDDDGDDFLSAFSKKGKKKTPSTDRERAAAEAAEYKEELLGGMHLTSLAVESKSGPPTRWVHSELSKEVVKLSPGDVGSGVGGRDSQREKNESAKERQRQEEEKQRIIGRDPLGIRTEAFDLRNVQESRSQLLEQALADIEEAVEDEADAEGGGDIRSRKRKEEALDRIVSLEAQREALEAILYGRTEDGIGVCVDDISREGVENLSILPTDPNFNPRLFLTLVHRNASFEQLQSSIQQLESKTDNQVQRLQNLVRDNFALFVRCADGIDLFSLDGDWKKSRPRPGIKDRLDTLDALSESSSYQAKKSFKPLLDNTNEVRKVQSALAVLQRVSPLLQVPSLMRQHIENGRFSSAVKAYRRVLVINDDCGLELLRHVKLKAAEAAREARRDLEATLANHTVPVTNLLDAIRDLEELNELDVPQGDENNESKASGSVGVFTVGEQTINVRQHSPALACLLLQSAMFMSLTEKSVRQADNSTQRIYNGETVSFATEEGNEKSPETSGDKSGPGTGISDELSKDKSSNGKSRRNGSNRWKYDILEVRVVATIRAVAIAKNWLDRLLQIGVAAREAERRRTARAARKREGSKAVKNKPTSDLKAYDVFVRNISPAVITLVEHATFLALGCSNSHAAAEQIKMTFGNSADVRLRTLLRAPLPPAQSAKCASELADLAEEVHNIAASAETLRPEVGEESDQKKEGAVGSGASPYGSSSDGGGRQLEGQHQLSPLDLCVALADEAVVTVERRRCIYAFDVCARSCASRASGSGTFDGDALLNCVQKLSEELTRAEDCANEVEKGCELVVRRCCEGLASYVRDRGDAARLRAVAECADALNGRVVYVVREVAYLTNGQCEAVEEALAEDIMALEATMFDEFLDNICRQVAGCTKLGSMSFDRDDDRPHDGVGGGIGFADDSLDAPKQFPAYLSACLLAIVRCRAQVERALGDTTIRRSQGITYQYLAMATAADGVVAGICYELNERMTRMTKRQADRFANELQFLMNTLKKYLSDDMLSVAENCRRMLCAKAGHLQGDGPDGLAAIEELERLGRIYVLCLGE